MPMYLKKMSLLVGLLIGGIGLKICRSILLSCTAKLPPSESLMPVFPVPDGESSVSLLEKHCIEGLTKTAW